MPYFNKTEIMKNILRRIRCGLLWGGLLACTGCNQEVFVDHIAPAETHFTMDGNGDTLVIDFPSEDWSVLDVTSESGKSLISFVSGDNGGPVTKMEDRERLEFSLGGLLDCAVVRDEGRRLVVMLGENLLQEDYRMDIHVGNDYVDIPLEFRLTLGEPYRVDSVVYRLEPDSPWTEVREGEGLVVYNQSADTIRQQLVISGKNRSRGQFSVLSDDNVSWLSGTDLEVPDSASGGRLVFSGMKLPFSLSEQPLPLSVPDRIKVVSIAPNEHVRIIPLLDYSLFNASYTVHASHPRNVRRRSLSGMYRGTLFTGSDYHIKIPL